MTYFEQAKTKLEQEEKGLTGLDKYQSAVKAPVVKALIEFCRQDEEFSRAVVEDGTKNLKDCLVAVTKSCGSVLSDLEAYRRAAQYYFAGAEIEFQMVIHVNPYELTEQPAAKIINLMDLL